jgi:beta-lactamase class A
MRLAIFFGTLCAVTLAHPQPSQAQLSELKKRMDQVCAPFRGRIGYSLKLLTTGSKISLRGDERFPTASTIKTAVMVEAIRQVEEGKLKWSDRKEVPSDMEKRQESAWAYSFKDLTNPTLDGWVNLMITVSDNTATMVLRDWLTMQSVNSRMAALGLPNTKVLGSFPPEQTQNVRLREMFGLGVTTPNEMARLLELIYRSKAASPEGCELMQRILSHQYWDDIIGASTPVEIKVACKSGAINRSRSDTAIVYGPKPYVLTLYTDSQVDQRWTDDNEGEVALRRLANIVWSTLNPKLRRQTQYPPKKFFHTGGI